MSTLFGLFREIQKDYNRELAEKVMSGTVDAPLPTLLAEDDLDLEVAADAAILRSLGIEP